MPLVDLTASASGSEMNGTADALPIMRELQVTLEGVTGLPRVPVAAAVAVVRRAQINTRVLIRRKRKRALKVAVC